jgi:RNA polymerase sigma factor (sigma-70 family)
VNAATDLTVLTIHHAPSRAGTCLPKPIKSDPRIHAHLYIAKGLAARFLPLVGGQRDFDDLVAVGLEALWRACESFEEDGGAAFPTFANTCVFNALVHEQLKCWRLRRRTSIAKFNIHESEDDDSPFVALVSSTPTPERAYAALEIARAVLSAARGRNRQIVQCVLDGDTLTDAGAEVGLSKERARQVFETACDVVQRRVERKEKRLA